MILAGPVKVDLIFAHPHLADEPAFRQRADAISRGHTTAMIVADVQALHPQPGRSVLRLLPHH